MVLTRSQARSRQPLDPVASPRANRPRRTKSQTSGAFQQSSSEGGVAVNSVSNTGTVGGRSVAAAAGSSGPKIGRKCRSDCLTCPSLVRSLSIKSNETGRIYHAIDVDLKNVHCKMQNYVYLLTCLSCSVQYVGESVVSLNKRMNIHRKGKSGCEISIDHYKNVCPKGSFKHSNFRKITR